MPPRLLRFRLRLMRFQPTVTYVKGTDQLTADALSRAPEKLAEPIDISFIEEVEEFSFQAPNLLPASAARIKEIRTAQDADPICVEVKALCLNGWPAYYSNVQTSLKAYWDVRDTFTVVDGVLLKDSRFVIPTTLQLDMLEKIHSGHQGITKCRARARETVWWPGLSTAIASMVSRCSSCAKSSAERKEPLLPSALPDRPWERVGSDLFEYSNRHYLLVVDYYSRWIELRKLDSTTSSAVVSAMKSIFATHGIPDLLMSDNGPQYASQAFRTFVNTYGFTHSTSSPRYPQANGEAERAVRTVKNILHRDGDPYLGLLAYRSTPLQTGSSPSQLLMGRRLRSTLPILPEKLAPTGPPPTAFRDREDRYKETMATSFNRRHTAKELPTLHHGDRVWVKDQQSEGTITATSSNPRSYHVQTRKGGDLRRNRRSLVRLDNPAETSPPATSVPDSPGHTAPEPAPAQTAPVPSPGITTRSGRLSRKPTRLDL